MKSSKILIAVLLSFVCLMATAMEGKWIKGYGQGNLEFFTDKGKARLYIGCPSEESNNGGYVNVMFSVDGREVKSFKVQADGNTFNGPLNSGTRGGSNDVIELINNLRKTDAKVTYGSNVVTFPKSNVTAVLNTYMSGKLGCAFN